MSEGSHAKANCRLDAAEPQDGAPVAGVGVDAFELVGLMFVASGDMSETRFHRAVDSVRKAVAREQ